MSKRKNFEKVGKKDAGLLLCNEVGTEISETLEKSPKEDRLSRV